MGSSWYQNFTQLKNLGSVSPATDMQDIPYPLAEYTISVVYKFAEVSAFVGYCVVNPVLRRLYRNPSGTRREQKAVVKHAKRITTRIPVIAILSAPFACIAYVQLKGLTQQQVRERCYQMRYNKKQLFLDRVTTVLGMWGMYAGRWYGFAKYVSMGLVPAFLYNVIFWKKGSILMRDRHETMYDLDKDFEKVPISDRKFSA